MFITSFILFLSLSAKAQQEPTIERLARAAAIKHGIQPDLFIAIIRVESNLYQGAYNARTQDYGAAQVNHKTAKAYGFDLGRLKTDPAYNLDAGARILSDFRRSYPKTYICRYNLGGAPLVGRRMELCFKYQTKVFNALFRKD